MIAQIYPCAHVELHEDNLHYVLHDDGSSNSGLDGCADYLLITLNTHILKERSFSLHGTDGAEICPLTRLSMYDNRITPIIDNTYRRVYIIYAPIIIPTSLCEGCGLRDLHRL